MKIILTGGGTGGHFYPLIAVAEALNDIKREQKIVGMELYFMSTTPYNEGTLYDNNLTYRQVRTGKLRRYFSLLNFIDVFKTISGSIRALWDVFTIYPDVVFGKGGYASFPALLAARILRIPVVIHESDTVPGRVNKWAGKFAQRIAISFPEAAQHFPKDKTAFTGAPVRKKIIESMSQQQASADTDRPLLLILGGSQGSTLINDSIIDTLPKLLEKFTIIHQTGDAHIQEVTTNAGFVLQGKENLASNYKPVPYMSANELNEAALKSSIIISRAGASTISEIGQWCKPSILIPITDSNGDHQRQNAFSFARTSAAVVIEEKNLTPNIIISEITRLIENPDIRANMGAAAHKTVHPDAARKIAEEITRIAKSHE